MDDASSRPAKSFPIWIIVLLRVVGFAGAVWAFFYLLEWSRVLPPGGERLPILAQFTIVNEKRKTLLQIVAGFSLIVTAVFYFWTAKAAGENAKAAVENARIAQGRLDSERFVKATENLGGDKLTTRIGAVYSLESIAHETQAGSKLAVEVLVAFLKDKARFESEESLAGNPEERKSVEPDAEASLRVIGRRPIGGGRETLIDLRFCNFHKASLTDIDLGTNDGYRHLALSRCILSNVAAVDCSFTGCIFNDSDLRGANLEDSIFVDVEFGGTDLQGARLRNATFTRTNFADAKLKKTDLRGADLTGGENLTQEQVDVTYMDQETKLPQGLNLPVRRI